MKMLVSVMLLWAVRSAWTIDMKAYLNTEVEDESLKVKIAFGSCFNPLEKEHSIFKDITRYDPQIFIWLGDFAYTDHKVFQGYFEPGS